MPEASSNSNGNTGSSSHSLLTIVLDVSPLAWQDHALTRAKDDKKRAEHKKGTVGPVVLEEVLQSVQAFAVAAASLERSAGLILIAVADNESAVVYPRADILQQWLSATESFAPDPRKIQQDLTEGVAELVQRATTKAALNQDPANRQAAMAAAFSKALCLVNRFLVAAQTGTGVSALQTEHYLNRVDDEGVIALMGSKAKKKNKAEAQQSAWSPRILFLQASQDRSRDYNAFMNCAFAAAKQHVVVDGCFLAAQGESINNNATSSAFLEQAVDLTGGVFLAPKPAAQVGGALTEVLFTVFLAPLPCRSALHLPGLSKVDFRARCFETGETVDQAFVCNQCLSIFQTMPKEAHCPTCRAAIVR